MSTPPIAARPDNKVADAAVMMLKHKVRSFHELLHGVGNSAHCSLHPQPPTMQQQTTSLVYLHLICFTVRDYEAGVLR